MRKLYLGFIVAGVFYPLIFLMIGIIANTEPDPHKPIALPIGMPDVLLYCFVTGEFIIFSIWIGLYLTSMYKR